MIQALRRLNEALPKLLLGILIYGALALVIGCVICAIISKDVIYYAAGLLIGIVLSVFMAIHIAIVIEDSVHRGEGATKILAAKSVMRYIIVAAVLFLMMWLHLGSLIGAFVGIIGLKVSAYAQPILNKALFKNDSTDNGEVNG